MAKKTSVSLIVMTELPDAGLVAILQRRGEFNHEKMGPESFPGACQVTVHGGMEESDTDEFAALKREIAEELGNTFLNALLEASSDLHLETMGNEDLFYKFHEVESENKRIVTYKAIVSPEFLKIIQLGPSSGGIRLLRKSEIDQIQNLAKFDKKEGIIDRRVVAMFPDAIETVRKAFGLLSNSR